MEGAVASPHPLEAAMKYRTGIVLGLLLAVPACWSIDSIDSEDVNEDALWGEYSVGFDSDDGELRFYAQFRVGGSTGTTVRLSDPSQVTANGSVMQLFDGDEAWLNLEGSYYYLEEGAAVPEGSYEFVWTRLDGSTYTNVVQMADSIGILAPMDGETISKTEGITVEFDGAVGTNESVSCWLSGNGSAQTEWVTSGNTCVFTAAELEDLDPGDASLWVRRRLEGDIQDGHPEEGGYVTSYFDSPRIEMLVTE